MKLEHEVEKNKILSTALQTLATEHHELEQSVVKGSSRWIALSEDEFHDAVSGEWMSEGNHGGNLGKFIMASHAHCSRAPVGHWNFTCWRMSVVCFAAPKMHGKS